MTDTPAPAAPPPNPKLELECEKLRAEIESLRKPLYQTPAFYASILPVVLAIAGVIYSWSSGWFDVQRTRLENDRKLLEAQNQHLLADQSKLQTQELTQREILERSTKEVTQAKLREAQLAEEVASLTRSRDSLQHNKSLLEGEIQRLADSDAKASALLTELRTAQDAEAALKKSLQGANEKLSLLSKTSARQEAFIRRANEIIDRGRAIAVLNRATWDKALAFRQEADFFQAMTAMVMPEAEGLVYTRRGAADGFSTFEGDVQSLKDLEVRKLTERKSADIYQRVVDRALIEGTQLPPEMPARLPESPK
jgi:DNA repair exonuclease SbcCD ATPase subunit